MNIVKDKKKYQSILMVGDLHGDFHCITNFVLENDCKETAIFQVGDFGVGFGLFQEPIQLSFLNSVLIDRNSILYVIKGNHDNPSYFTGKKKYSNIIFLPDYSIVEVNNKKIFTIGGAISVDRIDRHLNLDYWVKEVISPWKKSYEKHLTDISIIISHSTADFIHPFFVPPFLKVLFERDKSLEEELKNERKQIGVIYEKAIERNPNIEGVYYGHFHHSNTMFYKDIKFKLLGVNEIVEHVF